MDRIEEAAHTYNRRLPELQEAFQRASIRLKQSIASDSKDVQERLETIADMIEAGANICIALHPAVGALVPVPGVDTLWYYMGTSEVLDKAKLGISKDVERRAKSIRASMISLGFPGDFELHDWRPGEAGEVQRMERRAFQELAHLRRGGEWFVGEGEVYDWIHEAGTWLENDWRDRIARIDVREQIEQAMDSALRPLVFEVRSDLRPPEIKQMEALQSLSKAWNKALDGVLATRDKYWRTL